jgi:hypothetical protein
MKMQANDRRRFLTCAALCAGIVPLRSSIALAQGEGSAEADKLLAERRLQVIRAEADSRALYGKKLVERLGDRVLAAIKEVTLDSGRASGRDVRVAQRDLDGLVEIWKDFPPAVLHAIDERSPSLLRFKVTSCVYAEAMRKADAADLGFAYYCAWDYGFCETYSPDVAFERTKTLMQGNSCCDHTYRLTKKG